MSPEGPEDIDMPRQPTVPPVSLRISASHVQAAVAQPKNRAEVPKSRVSAPHVQASIRASPLRFPLARPVVQPAEKKADEKPTTEKSTTTTVLSKGDLVKSFLAEVSGWRYGVVWNTGHGGRIEGGKTLVTVTVKKADFEKAVDELKGKTDLKTKGGKALKYFNDSQSSKEKSENIWDIIFTQDGDTPGSGVEQLNFHIKRDDS